MQVLADRLWTRYELEGELVGRPEADADTAPLPMALGREEELAWSQKAFPNESVEVDALIQSALETAESDDPLIKAAGGLRANEGLPRLAVQLVPMRQALLNILTTALDWMPEGQLTIRAEHQPKEGQLQISIAGYGTLSSTAGSGDGGRALAGGA